ncbi:MAG: hypothetical protein N2688_07930, partial [Burkholderiaceae bacterium]|nr:hypothetical protein [Burkholderiaceae bacterium]
MRESSAIRMRGFGAARLTSEATLDTAGSERMRCAGCSLRQAAAERHFTRTRQRQRPGMDEKARQFDYLSRQPNLNWGAGCRSIA